MRTATPTHDATLPLLLLPGTLCDARIFEPLVRRLPGCRLTVIGTAYARSLQEAAQQVMNQAPEHFILLGFSLGGLVAMETALCAPERVRALALLSTTPLPVPTDRHAARRALVAEARTVPMRQFLRERLWPEYGNTDGNPANLCLLEHMADDLGSEVFAAQSEMALGRSDFRPRLAAISAPTLIVAGAEDVLCPPDAQRQLAAALKNSTEVTSVLLPGAGHFALVEQADEVAAAVAAWLHQSNAPQHAGCT